jgi:hypothetical protein
MIKKNREASIPAAVSFLSEMLFYSYCMKRLVLSIVCGFLVPITFTVMAVFVAAYVRSPILKQLVGIPVRWPLLIHWRLAYLPFPILLLYVTVCNVFFYGVLSYWILWMLSRRKAQDRYRFPPPPTVFKQ